MTKKGPIRFVEYDRSETLTNFPALVVLNEHLDGFSADTVRDADGYDLRFWNDAETEELDYEIERWDPFGTSYVWVRVPEFTSNCTIRAWWGDPTLTEQPVSCTNGAVWEEGFHGVWHLDGLEESTVYANTGSGAATALERGPVGTCARKFNQDASIQLGESQQLALTNQFTYSFWAKAQYPTSNEMYLYQLRPLDASQQTGVICGYYQNTIELFCAGYTGIDPRSGSQIIIPDGGWHHYAYTYDGSTWMGCRDGEPVFSFSCVFSLNSKAGANQVLIGSAYNNNYFRGSMDEFRVAAEPRSANWMYACYRNQRIRREGCDYLAYPVFGSRGTITDIKKDSVRVETYLSCRFPVVGRLCYGISDGGEDLDAWDDSLLLGTLEPGAIAADIAGLLMDQDYVCRYWASNEMGVAWSSAFTFRTASEISSFAHRMEIEISGYTGSETLSNFPVLIKLNEQINGFSYASFVSAEASDLRFVDENDTPLSYEIETWNTGGDSYVWVQVPQLEKGKSIWAYWKNRDAMDKPVYCENGDVWDTSFNGVYHLTPTLIDATLTENDVVEDNQTLSTNGIVSSARSFEGASYLKLGSSGSLGVSDCFTLSCWVKTEYPCIADMYVYGRAPAEHTGRQHALICGYEDNYMEFFAAYNAGADPRSGSQIPIVDDGWHYYTYSYDGWNWSGYCDGEQKFSTTRLFSLAFTDDTIANKAAIGSSAILQSGFTGAIDEFRVENSSRSASWIAACYANQLNTEKFAVCGRVVNMSGTLIFLK